MQNKAPRPPTSLAESRHFNSQAVKRLCLAQRYRRHNQFHGSFHNQSGGDMFLELDGRGPHYSQLTRAMKSAILSGRLVAGARRPPTRALAEELGVSRITVLTAYEQLRAEGYIVGRVGSGSYVSTSQADPMPPRQASTRSIAPLTRYAKRARQLADWSVAARHRDRRLDMQYGRPQVNPTLGTIWGRELAWAATHT